MDNLQLNLARKWRSKTFDEIVGQDLVVRLLKNSLYRSSFLPVYLLSGMRGCGKTSVGRLFAHALNCSQLEMFRQQPQQVILPCNACNSCNLNRSGQHPDFIEIDAASHTGVDNIRNLIDMASFVPILGSKKIYLIDEAHMLSKAAFNALLKILEEPPMSVIFMLATTDPHKIIDTVKSRSFQLFFNPIEKQTLINHLNYICLQEDIVCSNDALSLIVDQSEGSVRDALNIIERVRLVHSSIDKKAVIEVLGFLDDESLINLFEATFTKDSREVLDLFARYKLETYNTHLIWKKFISLLKISLLIKSNLKIDEFENFETKIGNIISKLPFNLLVDSLEIFYNNEFLFTKTSCAHTLFQLVLIKVNKLVNNPSSAGSNIVGTNNVGTGKFDQIQKNSVSAGLNNVSIINLNKAKNTPVAQTEKVSENENLWQVFLKKLDAMQDHLVNTVFKQARLVIFEKDNKIVEIAFAQNLTFFKELIDDTKSVWQDLLEKSFSQGAILKISFIDPVSVAPKFNVNNNNVSNNIDSVIGTSVRDTNEKQVSKPTQTKNNYRIPSVNKVQVNKQVSFTISDPQDWPKASILLKKFPGSITTSSN